jgi:hypothetical protein
VHYKKSIEPQADLSPLWKDVFLFHWKEESQHAVMDELEWRREDAKVTDEQREQGVTDLIDLVVAVDGILQGQAAADADYFVNTRDRAFTDEQRQSIHDKVLQAYRWQYIVSGIQHGRFLGVLTSMITEDQTKRITTALAPLM